MSTFKLIQPGHWRSEELQACILIYEDYGNTYSAYTGVLPISNPYNGNVCRNTKGNPIRFRSVAAAEQHLTKLRTRTGETNV